MTAETRSSALRALRAVALPAEHGGWGFLLEPLLLGLLVAPSWAGASLSLGVFGLYLLRHPLKLALADRRRGRRFARTAAAERFALVYTAVGLAGLGGAAALAGSQALLPLAAAIPLALTLLGYDAANRARDLLPELAAPAALAASAASIALAGGWALPPALALWAILAARAIPSVLYVRARLRLEHGRPTAIAPALLAHVGGLAAVVLLSLGGLAPRLAAAALVALLARAALGLSRWRRSATAKVIGFREMAYGGLTVLATAAGCALGV